MTGADPVADSSLPHLRLDADRAREDLEHTIDEIHRLAQPRAIRKAAVESIRRNPLPIVGAIGGALAVVGSILFVKSRIARRHG
jgi:hypothetical protein